MMSINDEMRGLILKHATADTIRECSKRQGMQSLLDYGMNLVKQQLTTLQKLKEFVLSRSLKMSELNSMN